MITIPTSRYPESYQKTLGRLKLLSPGRRVVLGPSLFRTFTCPDGCTACCMAFSLDFLPWEAPEGARPRTVLGRTIFTIPAQPPCRFLCGGLCSLWPNPPIECFAAPQVQIFPRQSETQITGRIFSRWWKWPEGNRPQCQFRSEFSLEARDHLVRVLERYLEWAEYFEIPTTIPEVINAVRGVESLPASRIVIEGGDGVLEP